MLAHGFPESARLQQASVFPPARSRLLTSVPAEMAIRPARAKSCPSVLVTERGCNSTIISKKGVAP